MVRACGCFTRRRRKRRLGRGFLGGGVAQHLDLDVGGDFAMQPYGYIEVAQRLERFLELDLAAIDLEALCGEFGGDIGRGHGAEEVSALARFAGEGEDHGLELSNLLFCLCLLGSGAAGGGGLHLVDDRLVRCGGLQRQLAGQQEIAAVAIGHLDDIAAVAQVSYVFFQNDFHLEISKVAGAACRPEVRCLAPRSLDPRGDRWLRRAGFYTGSRASVV